MELDVILASLRGDRLGQDYTHRALLNLADTLPGVCVSADGTPDEDQEPGEAIDTRVDDRDFAILGKVLTARVDDQDLLRARLWLRAGKVADAIARAPSDYAFVVGGMNPAGWQPASLVRELRQDTITVEPRQLIGQVVCPYVFLVRRARASQPCARIDAVLT